MKIVKRIGITQRVEYLANRDERRDCLDQRWITILLKMNLLPIPLPNNIIEIKKIIPQLNLHGIILSGGNDLSDLNDAKDTAPERDKFEHGLIDFCADSNIPLLGICRGLQIITTHYGGSIEHVKNHVAKLHELKVIDPDILPLTNRNKVNSFHQYGIISSKTGNKLKILAVADENTVEAVAHKKYKQWGIMWHPERKPFDPQDLKIIKRIFNEE